MPAQFPRIASRVYPASEHNTNLGFPRIALCYANMMKTQWLRGLSSICFLVLGCGDATIEENTETPNPHACDAAASATRTISCVESFEAGDEAGYGSNRYPDVIYGEPYGNGLTAGGVDVLSLGKNGVITVGFGGNAIVDGPGVDFIVFENPFQYGDGLFFRELGEVSVSLDGQTWLAFPCDQGAMPPLGCAGATPVLANGDLGISAYDPAVSGGDAFDLATLGLSEVRFVRIRDLLGYGAEPTAGFDLDAVSIVHAKVP